MTRALGAVGGRHVTAVAAIVLMLILVGSARAATYPSPPYDFSHPGVNHPGRPLFNSIGGQEDRPILVLYARWDDVGYPAGFDAAAVANRFFGTGFPSTTFPSVGDYFRRLSFNDLFLFPAAETEGTPNDGVVQITVPGTREDFFTKSEAARNKQLLQLADPFVDYASFDADGNGSLSNLELIVNVFESDPSLSIPQGCGIARGVEGVSLDGTSVGGLSVAMNNTATNLMTIIHENAHAATDMPDLYGFGVGKLDIAGPTCGSADGVLWASSAWQKLHWGWITPTVVDRDGYYEVRRADTTGDAFILYDPDRGTDDYFLVENRARTMGTYDQGASDSGLVIWRISDSSLGVDNDLRPIEPMMPDGSTTPTNNYGGLPRDAWNPADSNTPQRTMQQPWANGDAANVAVRAIGRAGDVIRAYFDVRGPGILVDTYPLDVAGPVKLTAGTENIVDVPIMSTGEACDTFLFQAIDMPVGWTMQQSLRTLCAGEASFARLIIEPDENAATGVRTITISGFSTTPGGVATDSPLSVDVVLTPSKFDVALLETVAPTGTETTFDVRLTSATALPRALGGVPVTFTLSGLGGTITAQATTNTAGFATATSVIALPPGGYSLTVTSERSGAFAPASVTVPYEVLSLEGAVESAADDLATLIAAATSPGARSALQAALDDLIGNNDGAGTNGALDKLDDDPAGAITKLRAALSDLLEAEARGAGDLSQLERLLGLTAEAIAAEQYEKAKDAVGTNPSRGEADALARILADIETGRAQLRAGQPLDACDNFRRATRRALDLSR